MVDHDDFDRSDRHAHSNPSDSSTSERRGSSCGARGRSRDERREDRDEHRDERRSRRRHRHGRHGHGRKERVLHTRISEQLSDDIRRLAEDLRVPASNLVRNVLEEVFTVVETVSDDVGDLFEEMVEEAEGARDRIRRRRDAQRRRGTGDSRRPMDPPFDPADIERELRRDERVEADAERRSRRSGSSEEATAEAPEAPTPETPRRPSLSEAFPDILGWQPLVLNHPTTCARCDMTLAAGQSGFMGVGERGLTRTTLCPTCAGSS